MNDEIASRTQSVVVDVDEMIALFLSFCFRLGDHFIYIHYMYGRDILVRVMYGARVSMSVGVFAAILVLVIGALYGAISGYCGGKVDAVMQRIVELIYAVPEMLVVLLIATALKPILTDYVNSSGTSPLKSFVNVLGPNLISMFIAFGLLPWIQGLEEVQKHQLQGRIRRIPGKLQTVSAGR